MIPKEAMPSTTKVADLYLLPQVYPAIGQLLRFEIIMNSMSLANKKAAFRRQAMPLESRLVKAISQLASFMVLTSDSQIAHISHIVADVVQGWHLSVVYREKHEWQSLHGHSWNGCQARVGLYWNKRSRWPSWTEFAQCKA